MAEPSRTYCTYFDSNYLSRGLAMIESLRAVGETGLLVVLALDDIAASVLAGWDEPNLIVISVEDVESAFPQVLSVKSERSAMEYNFTLTPWLTRYAMDASDTPVWVTYLDADLYFYSSCEPIYRELGSSSVGIVEHRFTPRQQWRRKYGTYNVAWVSFLNDEEGRRCLTWWADACLAWCFDEAVDGKFADQGYLDDFSSVTSSLTVLTDAGVDLAPWNLSRHTIHQTAGGEVRADGDALVFFHFHGLRKQNRRYHFKHLTYGARTTTVVREAIYRPYCETLETLEADPRFPHIEAAILPRQLGVLTALTSGRTKALRSLGVLRGDYLDI